MLVLRQIHETACATPRKLALVFNGAPLTYGTFWRFVEGCRRSLEPHLPPHGIALLWTDSLLEGWILELAVRALGLDTAHIRSADQAGLFAGLDVQCLITLTSEPANQVDAPSGAKRLLLSHHDPSHNDRELDRILTQARRLPEAKGVEDVSSAHESQSIDLGKA